MVELPLPHKMTVVLVTIAQLVQDTQFHAPLELQTQTSELSLSSQNKRRHCRQKKQIKAPPPNQ